MDYIHFSPDALFTNQDDTMAVIYTNWQGDSSGIGQTNKAEALLVDKEAANSRSYGIYSNRDNSKEFNSIKVMMTTCF